MLKKTYDKLKFFLKENIKDIVIVIVLYSIFMYPLDYYIIIGGGISEIGDRIIVDNEYKAKGSINLAYVSEAKGTIATYLLSYIMPNWEREKLSDYTYDNTETIKDVEFRSSVDLLQSSDNAIKNAFLEANKTYKVIEKKLYVYYVDKESKSNLKVGDQIISVNSKEVNDVDGFRDLLKESNENEGIKIDIIRNNKEKQILSKMIRKNNDLQLGIYVEEIHNYKTYPKVKIRFKKAESGPSGGLAETLDIYNKITKKDITKGKKISATGEIDSDGNILPIGGVKYKLLGASKKKVDIFIVPKKENYDECIKFAKKNNLKIKIIGVSTFKETLEKLEKIR